MLADTLRLLKLPPYSPGLNPVEHRKADLRENPLHYKIFSSIDVLDSGRDEQGVACATPKSDNGLRVARILLVIPHTPDKVLVDLKIVADDAIVEVHVPGAEGILFVLR